MRKKACFFCKTNDLSIFERNEFYKVDIQILQDLGYQVEIVTSWKRIPFDADLYFVWWWTYAFYPVLLAKLLRKKLIITGTFNLHNKIDGAGYFSRPLYQRILIKLAARWAPSNLVVSMYEFERLKKLINKNNVFYSPHTLDIQKYENVKSPGKRKDYLFSLAWMSRLNSIRKSIPELIKAVKILVEKGENINLLIAGKMEKDGEYLKALVNELNLNDNVKFLGLISEEEKIKRLKECKIYMQPTKFEGFGLAIAEALLCGTPVITSKVGAVPEVTNGKCRYVNGNSPEDIAEGIKEVMVKYTDFLKLGEEGKKYIEKNFNYERRLNDIKNLIEYLEESV